MPLTSTILWKFFSSFANAPAFTFMKAWFYFAFLLSWMLIALNYGSTLKISLLGCCQLPPTQGCWFMFILAVLQNQLWYYFCASPCLNAVKFHPDSLVHSLLLGSCRISPSHRRLVRTLQSFSWDDTRFCLPPLECRQLLLPWKEMCSALPPYS